MSVLAPGSSASEGNNAPKPTQPVDTAAQRHAVHAVTAGGASAEKEFDLNTLEGRLGKFRNDLKAIDQKGGDSRNVDSAKRGLLTQEMAVLYVGSAVRALASIGMDLKGNQDRLAGNAVQLRAYDQEIREALLQLEAAQAEVFTDGRTALMYPTGRRAPLFTDYKNNPDRTAFVRDRKEWEESELLNSHARTVVHRSLLAEVKALLAAETLRGRSGALVDLQKNANDAEVARWYGLPAFRKLGNATQADNGDWNFPPKYIGGPGYTRMMNAYVHLIRVMEGIRDGYYVMEVNAGVPLTTKVTDKAVVGPDTRKNAAKMPTTADSMEAVSRAVAAAGLTEQWKVLLEAGTVVLGGYQFLCSEAGINVIPPRGREQKMQLVHPHARVSAENLPRVIHRIMTLLDTGVDASTQMTESQMTALENDILGVVS